MTNEEGVGDFPNSYAYDGKRVRKWNVSCHPYGQPWMAGDVIGCCLNVDGGEISFYRNGRPLVWPSGASGGTPRAWRTSPPCPCRTARGAP